ncbi:MAG: hypothetical protein ACKOZT_12115 [Cyanobium sp.]
MPSSSPSLDHHQLDELEAFLKDWLRHSGRTQADLRRALRLSSIRMPVLLDALQRIHHQEGLAALAEKLCAIESLWQTEAGQEGVSADNSEESLALSFGQLDLLLAEIRQESDRPS